MAKSGYLAKVGLIFLLSLADLIINGVADHNQLPAVGFMPYAWIGAQLAIQLLNLLLIFLLFFGTYLFQVGLIGELLKEFKGVLFAALAYIAVYSCYAGVKLSYFAGDQISEDNLWGKQAFVAMSVLQKLAALGYYVLILHTTLRLGEAKWYQRGPWVSRYSNQANSVPTMAAGQLQGGSTQLQYSSAPKPMLATQSSSRNFTTTGSQR